LRCLLEKSGWACAGLVDRLCDPKRQRCTVLALVCAYAAVWLLYGVIAKSSQGINADMAEMAIWARQPALGYPKHPPLLPYLLRAWFSVFPATDWAFMLLAAISFSAGIYLAFELCGLWLAREKQAAVPFLFAAIPFYNFIGLKFDQNSALIPLWALTIFGFMHTLETRKTAWSILTGLAGAAAMLTKYWSGFLIAALALTSILDRRREAYWHSAAPWLSAAVFVLAVLPHVIWLVREKFPPLNWVAMRRVTHSVGEYLGSATEYTLGTVGYSAMALILVSILIRPTVKAVRDSWFVVEPVRLPATLLFWTPLLLPLAVAVVTKTNLLSLWNEPSLNLLPVMLLASPLIVASRLAVARLAAIVTTLTLAVAALSPLVAAAAFRRGVENNASYTQLAAAAIERQWSETTNAPLRLIGGRFPLVNPTAFYASARPSSFTDFSTYFSPWVNDVRIAHDGMAIICTADDTWCLGQIDHYLASSNPPGQRSDVTLTPHWLGLAGEPKHFVIAAIPPRGK
jgi:4-amino-4-deoxy-L-arabinose transferase-like glycosyltransferase